MATPSGQHDEMADLDFLTQGPELVGQIVGAIVCLRGGQVPIEGVRDAVYLDLVRPAQAVDDGDLEHFCAFVGEDGGDCGCGMWVLESLSWNFVQRIARLDVQKTAAPRAPRLHHGEKRCGATCATAPHHTNPLEGWCVWCMVQRFFARSGEGSGVLKTKALADSQSANFYAMACSRGAVNETCSN